MIQVVIMESGKSFYESIDGRSSAARFLEYRRLNNPIVRFFYTGKANQLYDNDILLKDAKEVTCSYL